MNQSRLLSYPETERILTSCQIPLVPAKYVVDRYLLNEAAAHVGFPLAIKIISPDMSHKSDAELLRLNIFDQTQLDHAVYELSLAASNIRVDGFLIQKMVPGGLEVLLGLTVDHQFGPVIVFGAGGVMVEFLKDTSMCLPPLNHWMAEKMIQKTRVSRLLDGYRNSPAVDKLALIDCIVKFSQMVQKYKQKLVSIDINPLFVLPQGVLAVDARVYWREEDYEK